MQWTTQGAGQQSCNQGAVTCCAGEPADCLHKRLQARPQGRLRVVKRLTKCVGSVSMLTKWVVKKHDVPDVAEAARGAARTLRLGWPPESKFPGARPSASSLEQAQVR